MKVVLNFLDRPLTNAEKAKLVFFSKINESVLIFTMTDHGWNRLEWNGRLKVKRLILELFSAKSLPQTADILIVSDLSCAFMLIARCPFQVWALMIEGKVVFT